MAAPQIILEGTKIVLESTSILNASSASGGGNIHVGGGWQGNDPTITNAKLVNAPDANYLDNVFIDP